MSLANSRTRLKGALKELQYRWDQVRLRWNDVKAVEFEKQFLEPMEPRLRAAMTAMEKMEATLARVRRDCG